MSVASLNKDYNISLKRVGGTGMMGVWVFAVSDGGANQWLVEFVPERLPYARVNMLPQSNTCTLPESVVSGFSQFIQERHKALPVQSHRKPRKTPPSAFIQALADILLNEEIRPVEEVQKEVESVIERYFKNPQYILPVKDKEHRYWFRSPEMGRFYVTQCPPTV